MSELTEKPWASSKMRKYQSEINGPHTNSDYWLHGLSPRTKGGMDRMLSKITDKSKRLTNGN